MDKSEKIANTEEQISWSVKYINRLIDRGIDKEFAVETYFAGIDNHDYNENPIDMADDELSYFED